MNHGYVLPKIESRFGAGWWTPPVFCSHEFSLRFQLAQGEFWIDRLESAQLRASTIVNAALRESREVHLVIARCHCDTTMANEEQAELSEAVTAYGLPSIAAYESQVVPPTEAGDFHTWLGAAWLPRTLANRALWAAFAADLGVLPVSPGRMFVVDIETGLLIHPYDDRGMDVSATSQACVQRLYDEFGHWLLDSYRGRMEEVLGR